MVRLLVRDFAFQCSLLLYLLISADLPLFVVTVLFFKMTWHQHNNMIMTQQYYSNINALVYKRPESIHRVIAVDPVKILSNDLEFNTRCKTLKTIGC